MNSKPTTKEEIKLNNEMSNIPHVTFDHPCEQLVDPNSEITPELKTLISDIKKQHETIKHNRKTTLAEAIVCGDELLRCKELAAHGDWDDFFEAHFQPFMSKMTYSRYTRLSKGKAEIATAESITEALCILKILKDGEQELKTQRQAGVGPSTKSNRVGKTEETRDQNKGVKGSAQSVKTFPLYGLGVRTKKDEKVAPEVLKQEVEKQYGKFEPIRKEFYAYLPHIRQAVEGGGSVEIAEAFGDLVTKYANDWNGDSETELDEASECNLRTHAGILSTLELASEYIQSLIKENVELSKKLKAAGELSLAE